MTDFLASVPVIDNHVHPLLREQPQDAASFRRFWSEAHAPEVARDFVPHAPYYRWTLRQLGQSLGVEASEDAILQRRAEVPLEQYGRELLRSANLAYLLLDLGYPPPEQAYSIDEMQRMLGVATRPILRLETLLQDLLKRHSTFGDLVSAFDEAVSGARDAGYVSLKSIAAYRTGLAIEAVSGRQAEEAFARLRPEVERTGAIRLASKPLIDFFLWRALRHAAQQELPVQFHTGYGDPDLDLRLANPLHLRPIFEDDSLAAAPIVMLHESYPYTAEAAFLATAYPNAYVDIAFTLPPLDRRELARVTGIALGVAPAGKVMVSSDGVCIPEQYWLGAVRARAVVGNVLSDMVRQDELSWGEAETIGTMVLRDNAKRVYGLE